MKPFTVKKTATTKISITISRKQLWMNFIKCWGEIAWDDFTGTDEVRRVGNVLLSGEKLDPFFVRRMFREGGTVMLMGDAMSHIDIPKQNNKFYREIIVTDDENPPVVVSHEDIVF